MDVVQGCKTLFSVNVKGCRVIRKVQCQTHDFLCHWNIYNKSLKAVLNPFQRSPCFFLYCEMTLPTYDLDNPNTPAVPLMPRVERK